MDVQGTTPVDVLVRRLVAAHLSPTAARQLITELRNVRMPTEPAGAAPSPGPEGSEVAAALNAAAASYVQDPGDDERAAMAIATRVGWSLVRAHGSSRSIRMRCSNACAGWNNRRTLDRLVFERTPCASAVRDLPPRPAQLEPAAPSCVSEPPQTGRRDSGVCPRPGPLQGDAAGRAARGPRLTTTGGTEVSDDRSTTPEHSAT